MTAIDGDTVDFDVMPETLAHTNLGALRSGSTVNIEGALRVGDPLGGHWVTGHVDGIGTVARLVPDDNALLVDVELPGALAALCVERGSVAIDGVSLTIMAVHDEMISLSLIPETRLRTTFGSLDVGTVVNVETDILAKHVRRLLDAGSHAS